MSEITLAHLKELRQGDELVVVTFFREFPEAAQDRTVVMRIFQELAAEAGMNPQALLAQIQQGLQGLQIDLTKRNLRNRKN
ncbi:MAG: hypothetical protein PVJ09_02135 [Candidatus Woesebacteria bacterium]|jgi:hypothetical protein